MSCEEFWNQMPDSLVNHASECAACAGRLAREQRLTAKLRILSAELSDVSTPARVEANLLAAFRATHEIGSRTQTRWWRMPVVAWTAAGAMAAALVVGVAVLPKRHVAPPATHHSASTQVELASFNNQETDDGFIRIPNTPQIDPNDDVNVVRMELPKSAMLAVGLNVSPEQVSDTVEAEVMLGSDGLARAVRFME